MRKTIYFALLHFSIATTVLYLLTGDFLLGSLIALIEPMINTVAFYFHEKAWIRIQNRFRFYQTIKTLSFATVHFSVAFTVVFLLTGDWVASSLMALIEPTLNTFAYSVLNYYLVKRSITINSSFPVCLPEK
ncbi:DUF2061 domain-containing protein [Vibrio sp. SS-MA-C1-2]|uniref:DUF2061 domain-containing protein n=1 Tax=Vibrio sp. SS-MA-C1-2 TaxID=2908646 RepID=UPI001F24F8E8|nr:DUF2061 domain-containing protein [Vibrio sp. SS-MA-C1-2]UJF17976.1 DUF2061 domain-containing protein [Vibrio sp. SS-MA-C1-2]